MNFKLQSDFGDLVTTSRQVSMPKLSGPDLAKLRADVLEVMRKENPTLKFSREPIITFIFELEPE